MNSTNNNSFEIAAKKVFNDLYALIKEDENMTLKYDKPKPIKSNKIDLNNDVLDKNNDCLIEEDENKPKQINVLDSICLSSISVVKLTCFGLSLTLFSSSFIKSYKSLNTFLAAISKELLFVEFIL